MDDDALEEEEDEDDDAVPVLLPVPRGSDRLYVNTLVGNRWDHVRLPSDVSYPELAVYDDQGFIVYPATAAPALDAPVYHGTLVNTDDDELTVSYTSLSTPALAFARAWGRAAGFGIPLRNDGVPYLPTNLLPGDRLIWRRLSMSVASPVRF
ncbi:MAG: hypothetical protein AAFV01_13945 [Bacteroidota bacterium]